MLPNLKVENLSCVRSEKAIFKNLNFEVLPGQNIEIVGSNGSGKTTLLRTLLGFINKAEGIINWLDEDNNFNEYRSFDCFYQGHQMGIKNLLTVLENLKLTHNAKGMNEEDINKCLERVGLYKINEMASDLSVGQKKRISIARWLLKDFKIYFIDEPFTALDDPASDLIKEIINELNQKGRERLLEAFEKVNRKFNEVYTKLFNGGSAKLELVDSDDPLDAGLEMLVSPPGKRLQSITLLSGGEQALTALSLVFAVFLTNPSPICVLDEVDATLDDANVTRFCNLLDELIKITKTKFIIVTHHALTMSKMNRLYGVTMPEKGISQLVSVDLEKAESMVA